MARVKLRIEVGTGSTGAGLNSSPDKNANNVGFSSVPNSYDNAFKGTSLLRLDTAVSGKSVHFNSQGYLANANDEQIGRLQSEQNKRQFVYGSTDANGEYELTLTLTTDTGTFDKIIIVGDTISNQFPIEAIVDSTRTVYSDDANWAIDLGDEEQSHTIKFTKWNKANYNACFNQIKLMLQYYEIDKFNGLKSVDSLSQSTPDASGIYYGSLANSGKADLIVADGELEDLIVDGVLDNSNVPVEVYVNDKLVQTHITTDSNYTQEKMLSLQFTNKIENWDKMTYGGYAYQNEPKNAFEILNDVLTGLGYNATEIDNMLSEQIIYGDDNGLGTIKQYLQFITIPYPYLPSDTYRNTVDKFCRLAQLQVFQKDDGTIKFVSARPICTESQVNDSIEIPKYAQIKNLDKTIILKNKYDAVEINEKEVQNQYEYDAPVLNRTENVDSHNFDSGDLGTGTQLRARVDAYYASGTFFVPETEDLGKIKYVSFGNKKDFSANNENRYFLSEKDLIDVTSVNNTLSDTNTPLDFDTMKSFSNYAFGATPIIKQGTKFSNEKVFQNIEGSMYREQNENIDFSQYTYGFFTQYKKNSNQFLFISHNGFNSLGQATSSFTDNSSITITKVSGGYNISYNVLSKILICGYIFLTEFGATRQSYLISEKKAQQILFTIYGDKRTLVFKDVSASDNVANVKTIATIQDSELLQIGTRYKNSIKMSTLIKNNIKNDYSQGISNGSIDLFCLDFKDTNGNDVIKFNAGEVLQTNDIISIVGDNKKWKITGRNFDYKGQCTSELQVEEVKSIRTWEDVFTYQGLDSAGITTNIKKNITQYKITGITDLISENVIVPSYHNGKPITKIAGFESFDRKTEIETILLPDTLKEIDYTTFKGLSSLVSINIPEQVKILSFNCFEGCSSLTSIIIPSSVTYFGECIFKDCVSLATAYIYATSNSNSSQIGNYARSFFIGCSGSLEIHIPSSVTNPETAYGQYWNYYSSSGQLSYTADL